MQKVSRLRLRMAMFTSTSRSLVRMIAGWLPWEIDCSQFSPQSQSTWSPQLPPTHHLPPPITISCPLTHSLGWQEVLQFSHRENFPPTRKSCESLDTGGPSSPAVCRLLSRAEPVADDLPGTAATNPPTPPWLGGGAPGPAEHIHRSCRDVSSLLGLG